MLLGGFQGRGKFLGRSRLFTFRAALSRHPFRIWGLQGPLFTCVKTAAAF